MSFVDISTDGLARLRASVGLDLTRRLAVWRTRRSLAKLDARALEDIGVTPDAAAEEARLGLWDVPPSWRQR